MCLAAAVMHLASTKHPLAGGAGPNPNKHTPKLNMALLPLLHVSEHCMAAASRKNKYDMNIKKFYYKAPGYGAMYKRLMRERRRRRREAAAQSALKAAANSEDSEDSFSHSGARSVGVPPSPDSGVHTDI